MSVQRSLEPASETVQPLSQYLGEVRPATLIAISLTQKAAQHTGA